MMLDAHCKQDDFLKSNAYSGHLTSLRSCDGKKCLLLGRMTGETVVPRKVTRSQYDIEQRRMIDDVLIYVLNRLSAAL